MTANLALIVIQRTQQLSSLIQPFFAPGIMFNTIKSGITVDWDPSDLQVQLMKKRHYLLQVLE